MSDSPGLRIRPWHAEDQNKHDLPFLLARLLHQGGGTLNFTEESLEEEIRRGESQAEDADSPTEKDQDEKTKAEQMQTARAEILKFAHDAFQESALALDLVSLLLTKYTPTAASSVSPALKNSLPMSTLAAEVVQASAITETQKQNDKLVTTGWKLQALNSAADSILKSATNLEEEMKKEAKYWNQVLAIKEKGWAISKTPRERHVLGVRFGFLEASPDFRDKSMAALRRNVDGSINLDLGNDFPGNKTLRARIVQNNITVAVCKDTTDKMEDDSVESAILQARNNIFDAELFSELLRECRSLTTHGVRWTNSRINVPLDNDSALVLELVDHQATYPTVDSSDHRYERLPQLVLIMLRILLSYSHSVQHKQRTTRSSVIGEKPRVRAAPALLRPLLSQLLHRNGQSNIRDQLTRLANTLEKAVISAELLPSRNKLDLERLANAKASKNSRDFIFSLLTNLTTPLETMVPFRVLLPEPGQEMSWTSTKQLEFSIFIRTHGAGSEYKLLLEKGTSDEGIKALYQETSFHDPNQVIDLAISSVKTYLGKTLCSIYGRLRTIAREASDLYVENEDGALQTIQLDLKVDSLRVLYMDPVRTHSEDMILEKAWLTESEASRREDGLIQVVSTALIKTTAGPSW